MANQEGVEKAVAPVPTAEGHRMSTFKMMTVFALYAFLRSAKPSSSYLHQFIDAADEDENPEGYVKLYSRVSF